MNIKASMFRALSMAAYALCATLSYSGELRDFSPLSIGNVWVYKGISWGSTLGYVTQDSVKIVLNVENTHQSGDTLLTLISVVENRFHRISTVEWGTDTAWISDSEMNASEVKSSFYKVEVGDSILSPFIFPEKSLIAPSFLYHSIDSSHVSDLTVGGANFKVACFGREAFEKSCFAKDIGQTYFKKVYGCPHMPCSYVEFALDSFNGAPINGSVVGVKHTHPNEIRNKIKNKVVTSRVVFDDHRLLNGKSIK
jgi:hypothetical protein